jgi:hypothetical protein
VTRLPALAALVVLGVPAGAHAEQQDRPASGAVGFGPRLLEYPVECVDPRGCRIECYQNGVKVLTRVGIGLQDEVRLLASAGEPDEIVPRWFEIRPFDGNDVQTLILSPDTFCDLKALVISPKSRQ